MILVSLLWLPLAAQSMTALFYQPQVRDMQLSNAAWPAVFREVRRLGIDTLVLQWSQHGDSFAEGQEQRWLNDRLEDAIDAGLNLVIGLYADPQVFSRLEQPTDLLETYFLKLLEKDRALAGLWATVLPGEKVIGWYLPLEIDDRRWREAGAFDVLVERLHAETDELNRISGKPVFISSFFAGNSSPDNYAAMVRRLTESTGLKVWIQDGRGTHKLTDAQRGLYLNSLFACPGSVGAGLIFEIFNQVGADDAFRAERRDPASLRAALSQRAPCGGDNVFFELRYLVDLHDSSRP